MTKKIFIIIAALGVIAMFALGCSTETEENSKKDSNNNILAAPVVELPANVGVNPFKGKTFERAWGEYSDYLVFSNDGKTVISGDNYNSKEFVPSAQLKYSIDANKGELSWHMEKAAYGYDGQMRSFEELATYIRSGKFLEDYKARLKVELDKGYITVDRFDKYLKDQKEWIDKEIASGFPKTRNMFAVINRYKYEYNEDEGTLDLYEQFEKSSARFSYDNNEIFSSNELSLYWVDYYKESDSLYIGFKKDDNSIYFDSKSVSDGKIIFVNEDDENDTFTARYELTGSGNNTKVHLSFTYDGKKFNPTLDFVPSERHLTEVK